MKITVTLEARQAEAMRLISRKEHRAVVQYLRDAVHFLLRDRATDDAEVRQILGIDPVPDPAAGEAEAGGR